MKKMIVYFLCVVCIFMASCSHDPVDSGTRVHEWVDSTINGNATMSEMKFSIGRNMVVESHAQTRTTTEIDGSVTFSTGDLIAIAVTQAGNPEEVKLYRVTSDGSLEYAGSGESFKWERNTVSIRAWSYGTSTEIANTLTPPEDYDYSLTANQQTSDYLELLYCKAASHTYASSPVTLSFYHQLSRLVINVSHDLSTTLSITSVSVGSSTFPTTARFSVPTGSSNVGSWTPSAYGTIVPKTETAQGSYQATYSTVVFPNTYTKDSKIFTLTNSDGSYIYSITESAGQTFTAGNQYTLAINVRDDITKNPLWWVAQYNLAENKTSFVTAHSTTSPYVFSLTDAQNANISYYHLPIRDEIASIIPVNVTSGAGMNIFGLTNTSNNPYEFSEIACNVGGSTISASTSVIYKKSSMNYFAVRFINTPYCSAWHYKYVTSPCAGLLVESYLLSGVTTIEEAKTAVAAANFTEVVNTGTANQTPENTTVTAKGYVQRFFPTCGIRENATSGTANYAIDYYGNYWTSTSDDSNIFTLHFGSYGGLHITSVGTDRAQSVRLFKGGYLYLRDATTEDVGKVICSNGHIHNTVSDVTCGGTASAMIAYVGNQNNTAGTGAYSSTYNHGLAIALTDVKNTSGAEAEGAGGTFTASEAITAASAYKRVRPSASSTWFLPSVYQLQRILIGCGSTNSFISNHNNISVATNSYSHGNLKTYMTNCGGTEIQNNFYRLSTTYTSGIHWIYSFGSSRFANTAGDEGHYLTRAIFAF